MRTKLVAVLAPALALGVLAFSAEAEQHRATRLGSPATRFSKPVKHGDDVRVLVRGDRTRADVANNARRHPVFLAKTVPRLLFFRFTFA